MSPTAGANHPPPRGRRPRGVPLEDLPAGLALLLWLDSIPCVKSGGGRPASAPLTEDEEARMTEYFKSRPHSAAAAGERRRTA